MIPAAPFVPATYSLMSLPVRAPALSATIPTFPWRRRAYPVRAAWLSPFRFSWNCRSSVPSPSAPIRLTALLEWFVRTAPFPPRRLRPLLDVGESRSVVAPASGMARPSSLRLAMVSLLSLMNSSCSSGVALLYGMGRGLRVEKPSRPATLRAVLRLHATPNLLHIRPAGGPGFQLPRPDPLPGGGLPAPPPGGALPLRRREPRPARALAVVPAVRPLAPHPVRPPAYGAGMAPRHAGDLLDRLAAPFQHGRLKPVPRLAGWLAPVHPFKLGQRHVVKVLPSLPERPLVRGSGGGVGS